MYFYQIMAPTLYVSDMSAPTRAVLMTAKAINLELNLKQVDFLRQEHLAPEFVKINPQHTVPTFIDDDGFILWESQAIMVYLVSKYAKSDSLYPTDAKKRALINQIMHFNTGWAFFDLLIVDKAVLWHNDKVVARDDVERIFEVYCFLEKSLKEKEWIAGDRVTIADYGLVTTVSTLDVLVPLEFEDFPNVFEWWFRCEELPEYKLNRVGLKKFDWIFKKSLSKKNIFSATV